MEFYEILDQVIDLLRNRGRMSYRALQRQFHLDASFIEDLKEELLYSYPVRDDEGRGLIWAGDSDTTAVLASISHPQRPPVQREPSTRHRPTPPEPPTPDAERRQLTVMFCDLADSTKLSGQLDPEDLRDVIRAYQSTSADVIERYDGYIAQHLGDGLMVYFGWPQAHEDDAQRAVHAGLGILAAIHGLNVRLEQDKGIRLAVRIGIHTGLVVVGEIGQGASQEHLALGETPNVASRIEGIAESDTVAISDATYQLVQGYFICEDLGQHTLRGVDDAQQVHRVVRESDAQSRFDIAATRGLTPLVGRESESALLFDRWQQVKDRHGQVVLLSGEAGIGKSRLLQVMKEHVADEAHTLLECRSSPYYENTAWYPITDMLQRMCQWHQDDMPEAKLDKLEQMLSPYSLELGETVPLFAALLSLPLPEDRYPPLNWSPQRQRQKTLATIVTMLVRRTEQQAILFILEDLHWTDPSTLELLDLLIDQTPTAALCVLSTCRPAFQPPWSGRSYLTHMTLNRLSRHQIEQVAEGVAGGKRLPKEVLQQVVEKTDGVPLFVEEMTKAILESGHLKEADGHYELVDSLSSLAIPTTLQDSLMARLDRLVTAKAMAQYAAVIGRQFSYELLQAVSQLDEATLQRELGRLVDAELVYQRGSPPQATYIFKHALVVDVAYESLLKSTRQQYHQRIAQMLEERFPGTTANQPELLAHHYTNANLNEQAVTYWQQSGQRASERSAHVEAISHLSKGLDVLTALSTTPEHAQRELALQVALGASLTVTKGWGAPEVGHTYARARELCRQVEDSKQLFLALRGLANHHALKGDLQTGGTLKAQLLRLAERHQDREQLLVAHREMSIGSFWLGDMAPAHMHAEKGLALYDLQRHRHLAFVHGFDFGSAMLVQDACVLWLLGFPGQAKQRSGEALTLVEELDHPFSRGRALVFTALLHLLRREGQIAKERAAAAMALSMEQGFAWWLALATALRGWALTEQGQLEKGVSQICEGLDACRATGGVNTTTLSLAALAEARAKRGQIEEGLSVLDEALAVVEQTTERIWEAEIHRLKGVLLLQQSLSDAHHTEACFQHALDIARSQQAKSLELRAATNLARLWQSQGKRQEAYDLLMPVYGWFTEGFDTADLKEAKVLLSELR